MEKGKGEEGGRVGRALILSKWNNFLRAGRADDRATGGTGLHSRTLAPKTQNKLAKGRISTAASFSLRDQPNCWAQVILQRSSDGHWLGSQEVSRLYGVRSTASLVIRNGAQRADQSSRTTSTDDRRQASYQGAIRRRRTVLTAPPLSSSSQPRRLTCTTHLHQMRQRAAAGWIIP